MTPVLDFDPARRTNSAAICDLVRLGWLHCTDQILDLTIGPEAGFWTGWRPPNLVTNDVDLTVDADLHEDGRRLPMPDRWCDVVVWDPPYANRGQGKRGNGFDAIDRRFGTTEYRTPTEVEQLLVDGTREALRVCSRLALVKCQDACVASRYRPQSYLVWETARQLGATLAGELHVTGRREQPTGKTQLNVWANVSTLLVLRKGKR